MHNWLPSTMPLCSLVVSAAGPMLDARIAALGDRVTFSKELFEDARSGAYMVETLLSDRLCKSHTARSGTLPTRLAFWN